MRRSHAYQEALPLLPAIMTLHRLGAAARLYVRAREDAGVRVTNQGVIEAALGEYLDRHAGYRSPALNDGEP